MMEEVEMEAASKDVLDLWPEDMLTTQKLSVFWIESILDWWQGLLRDGGSIMLWNLGL